MMGHKLNKRIEVNSVSLVNLKAEIARRHLEVKSKSTTLTDGCTIIPPPQSSNSPNFSPKSVFRRFQTSLKSAKQRQVEQDNKNKSDPSSVEQAEWDHIRRNLEAKAKLYDALQQTATTSRTAAADDDKAPLVDFERKAMETASNFHYSDNSSDDDYDEGRVKRPKKAYVSPVSIPEGPVTYAHLRKGEVRDHGVGFYGFSEDAATRASEQAALRELRKATEKARQATDQSRAKRDIQMAQRLAKLRARKGLPDVATAAAKCLGESADPVRDTQATETSQEEIRKPDSILNTGSSVGAFELGSNDLDIASMLRRLRDEAEIMQQQQQQQQQPPYSSTTHQTTVSTLLPASSKRKHGREWDKGKMALPAQHFISVGQHQLGEPLRDPQFAPPRSLYR